MQGAFAFKPIYVYDCFMPPVINVHTHFQPSGIEEALIPHGLAWITNPDGSHTFTAGAIEYRMPPTKPRQAGFYGAELHTRIPYMDEEGVDVHLLSASPMMFGYHLDPGSAAGGGADLQRRARRRHRRFPDRFWGAAQLPMQDPEAATLELERAVRELGPSPARSAGRLVPRARSAIPTTTACSPRRSSSTSRS